MRSFNSAQVRALLSVGILLGVGSVGTMARFTASGDANAGSFTTGSLDVRLNASGNNVGQGGTWTNASLAISDITPGESLAVSFPVRNDGTTGFTYTATATATGALAPQLRFSTYTGGTASNSGNATNDNRVGTCSGSAASTNQTLSGTAANVISTAQTLNPSATQNVCVIVQLVSTAASSTQGDAATATFAFNAVQP
ncbi:SipW-dependent-type signal peptide-containing protein [Nocardioides sp.]|uniref:SipW-dependent-type signal peptide-containing protein n=1 Tax=Nocardioides sp. TaxID=35761 RepID=UPI003D147742